MSGKAGTNLVIVESPAKATTIERYLGPDYTVLASYGHVRDLPQKVKKGSMSIDIEHGFTPVYEVIEEKAKRLEDLKKAAKRASTVWLATDLDREGEAIAWHVAEALGIPAEQRRRVTFSEITKGAILDAFTHPRGINQDLVDAQQARRILDRLVGYRLSPLLSRLVKPKLSAGRVQSVALRLVVERERAIRAFVPRRYFTVELGIRPASDPDLVIAATLVGAKGETLEIEPAAAEAAVARLQGRAAPVLERSESTRKQRPVPPFITSTLQQEAGRKHGFRSKVTMQLAQRLYEGVEYNGNQYDATYVFGYNATNFCRSGTEGGVAIAERCFKRSKDDAIKSVWRYGVYNADGSRFDLPSPGFSVRDAAGNWGYASYWGLWFSNPPADGDTVTNAKTGTAYTVKRGGGKLIKTTRYLKKLDEIKNNKFEFTNMTAGSGLSAQTTYEAYWDETKFKVVGTRLCGQNGCFNSAINTIEVTPAQLLLNNTWGISGWSQSLGRVTIPATTLSDANPGTKANGVNYLAETMVKPGETVPTNLKCVANCPTVSQINAFVASPANTKPFDASTVNSWSGIASPIAYTWSSSAYSLTDASNAQVSSDLLANINMSDFDKTNYKWGIRSGALVDATKFVPGGDMDCDGQGGNNNYCDSKSYDLDEYYQFEIGAQDYNRATFLMSGVTPVAFSAPLTATFDVPNDSSKYGLYAGASMNLQFLGFGDLNGIPGRCVDPYTNQEASCSSTTRWLPSFVIEDGSTVTIDGQTKYVKWLERELRFAPANGTATTLGITLGSTSNLPSAITTASCTDASDTANPCNPSSDNYPGAFSKDDFKKAPSVIHGVVQQQ